MKYKSLPSEFYTNNRKKLYNKIEPNSAVFIAGNGFVERNNDQYYPFKQESNFLHLCGIEEPYCFLILFPNHPCPSEREVLLRPYQNEKQNLYQGYPISNKKLSEISGIKNIKYNEELSNYLEIIFEKSQYVYTLNEYKNFNSLLKMHRDCSSEPMTYYFENKSEVIKSLNPLMAELRLIKQDCEIKMIKKSIDITAAAFDRVLRTIKPGLKEYEIEAELTYEFAKKGSSFHAFSPIVAGGKNACTLHYDKNDSKLNDGEMLLLDFGAYFGNYAADCSRTIPINGKFSKKQALYYNAVLQIFKSAIKLFVPGTTIAEINKKVIELTMIELDKLGFDPKDYKKYYPHGVTHFIGLDVHDVGDTKTPLEKGMVLSCEPGLYFKNEGIGIRIETDILVDDKPLDLMKKIPVEIDSIEKIINSNKKILQA